MIPGQSLSAPPPLRGRYLLEGRVGAGGMGVVWRARDIRLDRIVAVKVLRPEFAGSPEFRDLLLWEGRLAGRVSHPGVVQVRDYDDGSAGGVPYLVMEYVAGPSLAAVLRAEGTLSPRRVLGLIAQAAEALACAHAAGVVHRDVKPGNVLVDGRRVKIADFGIAQAAGAVPVTQAGLVMGTPAYLSPERAAGLPATPASDLYGLGMIAYECLTGQPPFQGSPLAVALAHMDRPLPSLPDTVPAPVAELVAALAAKDPQRRPGDALALAEWARRLRDDPQVIQAAAGPVRTSGSLIPGELQGGNWEAAPPAPAQFGRRRPPPARSVCGEPGAAAIGTSREARCGFSGPFVGAAAMGGLSVAAGGRVFEPGAPGWRTGWNSRAWSVVSSAPTSGYLATIAAGTPSLFVSGARA